MTIYFEILKKNKKSKITIPGPIVPFGPPDDVLPDDVLKSIQVYYQIPESSIAGVWDIEERGNVLLAISSVLSEDYYPSMYIESDGVGVATGYILIDVLSQEVLGITEMMFGNVFVMIFDNEKFRLHTPE